MAVDFEKSFLCIPYIIRVDFIVLFPSMEGRCAVLVLVSCSEFP